MYYTYICTHTYVRRFMHTSRAYSRAYAGYPRNGRCIPSATVSGTEADGSLFLASERRCAFSRDKNRARDRGGRFWQLITRERVKKRAVALSH